MGAFGRIGRPTRGTDPVPEGPEPINLSQISSSAQVEEILARGQKPGVVGNKRFVETAEGKAIRLENRRKLTRALHLNQLRGKFRSRGIQGTQTRRKPREAEGRLRKSGGELRVSKPSLLGG